MVPFKITDLKQTTRFPKNIVLHHTACILDDGQTHVDTIKFQAADYERYVFMKGNSINTKFHFIIEYVRNDFYVIVGQPLFTESKFDDIPDRYNDAIHIAFLGNYNDDVPRNRMYKVLAFRLLAPFVRLFRLKENDIVLHSDISENKDQTCPGEFIDMDKIKIYLRGYLRRRPITRK